MTVLVGLVCSDGIVIGTDSAMTSAAGLQPVVEITGGVKIECIAEDLVVATTGAVGLSQRLEREMKDLWGGKHKPKLKDRGPVNFGTMVSESAIDNFKKTKSPRQEHPQLGWEFGALVGVGLNDGAHLLEFDQVHFNPEVKGLSDDRGAQKTKPFATMGSGQRLGDPFLAHIHRLLCGKVLPDIHKGKLLVSWTLDHVIRYNTGGVGGDQQIIVLSSKNNQWATEHIDVGEIRQQVEDIEKYIEQYPIRQREKETSPDTPDVRAILDSEQK